MVGESPCTRSWEKMTWVARARKTGTTQRAAAAKSGATTIGDASTDYCRPTDAFLHKGQKGLKNGPKKGPRGSKHFLVLDGSKKSPHILVQERSKHGPNTFWSPRRVHTLWSEKAKGPNTFWSLTGPNTFWSTGGMALCGSPRIRQEIEIEIDAET
jgi:hypothetical protein